MSLVSGLLVLLLTWDVCRRIFGSGAAAIAVVAAAIAPALIRYSSEVKQYVTDAAAAVAIIDVTLALLLTDRGRGWSWRRVAAFGIVDAVACSCSHAAMLTAVASFLPWLASGGQVRVCG